MIVWRRMKPTRSSSGPGLSRIASGIAILPTSCSSAAAGHLVELLGAHAAARGPTASASSAMSRRCACRSGSRSDERAAAARRATGGRRTSGGRPSGRTCAGRPAGAPRGRGRPRPGSEHGPVGGCHREALAALGQRRRAGRQQARRCPSRPGSHEHAELVAAEPVGAPVRPTASASRAPRRASSSSPAGWPKASLYSLKPSRSKSSRARGVAGAGERELELEVGHQAAPVARGR